MSTYDREKMFEMALASRNESHSPYSKFKVGVCIFADDGHYYGGCNIENTSFPEGQCAEATAIGNMIVHGGRKIIATLVVTDTVEGVFPCGGCLQKLSEFSSPNTEVLIANLKGIKLAKPFREMFHTQFASAFSDLKQVKRV